MNYRKIWETRRITNGSLHSPLYDDTGWTYLPSPSATRYAKYQMVFVTMKKKGPRVK